MNGKEEKMVRRSELWSGSRNSALQSESTCGSSPDLQLWCSWERRWTDQNVKVTSRPHMVKWTLREAFSYLSPLVTFSRLWVQRSRSYQHFLRMHFSSNSTGTSFPVTSSWTCWRRRQLPRNKLATSYKEVGDVARPSRHVEMVWKSPASS